MSKRLAIRAAREKLNSRVANEKQASDREYTVRANLSKAIISVDGGGFISNRYGDSFGIIQTKEALSAALLQVANKATDQDVMTAFKWAANFARDETARDFLRILSPNGAATLDL